MSGDEDVGNAEEKKENPPKQAAGRVMGEREKRAQGENGKSCGRFVGGGQTVRHERVTRG